MSRSNHGRIVWLIAAALLLSSPPTVYADYLVTRAYRSATNAEFERVFSSKITRTGNTFSVGDAVELTPELADAVRVWGVGKVDQTGQLVYAAYDPADSLFDELFVVDLRNPGVVRQLNPPRV